MQFTEVSPLLSLYIAQFLFGCLYAWLIHWLSVNEYLEGSTAYSVVVGDAATMFIQWLFLPVTWHPMVTFGSFVCSGTPMIVTYLFRHEQKVLSHKRRPWPTAALKARDEAIMELAKMAYEIVDEKASVASVVHRLHIVIGTLKSV